MDLQRHPQRTPAASDAEIRAFLRPLLKAGTPPTYETMRATLGGGFSRLARLKKQVERELAGGDAAERPAGDPGGAALIATLEALFDRHWRAIEEWERRSLARLETPGRPLAAKATGVAEAMAAQADRLEAVERRLRAAIDTLQALTKASSARAAATIGERGDVPPAWARQAAAAATAALDGRLQSMEETVRDAAEGARGAFDQAAEIAREVSAGACLELQGAGLALGEAMRTPKAGREVRKVLDDVRLTLDQLSFQLGAGFTRAAAERAERAKALSAALVALVDVQMGQVEMMEASVETLQESIHSKGLRRWRRERGGSRGER